MSVLAFVTAVLALLLAPGPTNTLMGIAGAQHGLRWVLRLLPAELLGYLTTILPLAVLGTGLFARFPAFGTGLKIAAALWVLFLALKLWRAPAAAAAGIDIGLRRVYMTTALNPKALIFGLVLLPPPQDADFLPCLLLFCLMVAGVALIWGGAGAITRSIGGTQDGGSGSGSTVPPVRLRVLYRAASVWLAFVAVSLIVSLVHA